MTSAEDSSPRKAEPSDPRKPVTVGDIAHARSGDKGDKFNIGVIAWTAEDYKRLKNQLTTDRVKQYFGDMIQGEVKRFEMENIWAMNFVCNEALDGGGQASLRYDTQGKTYGAALMMMELSPREDKL